MKNNKNLKKINWYRVMGDVFICLLMVALGFILGMVYQQVLFSHELAYVLSYTDIEINFNGTKFAEELNNTFIPAWKQVFNETIHNQLNLSNKS